MRKIIFILLFLLAASLALADPRTFILSSTPDGQGAISARSKLTITLISKDGPLVLFDQFGGPNEKVSASPISFTADYRDSLQIQAWMTPVIYSMLSVTDPMQKYVESEKSLSPLYLIDTKTHEVNIIFGGLDKESVKFDQSNASQFESLCLKIEDIEAQTTGKYSYSSFCQFLDLSYTIGTRMRKTFLSSSAETESSIKADDTFSRLSVDYSGNYKLSLVPGSEEDTKVSLNLAAPIADFNFRSDFSVGKISTQQEIDNRSPFIISVEFKNAYGDGKAPSVYLIDDQAYQISYGNKIDGSCYSSISSTEICPYTTVASGSQSIRLHADANDLILADLADLDPELNPNQLAAYIFSPARYVYDRGPNTGTYGWDILARNPISQSYYEYVVAPGGYSVYFTDGNSISMSPIEKWVTSAMSGSTIERDFNLECPIGCLFGVGVYEAVVELNDQFKTKYKNIFNVEPTLGTVADLSNFDNPEIERPYSFSSSDSSGIDPVSVFADAILYNGVETSGDNVTLTKTEEDDTSSYVNTCVYNFLNSSPITDGYVVSYTGTSSALVTFSFLEQCQVVATTEEGTETYPGFSLLRWDLKPASLEVHLSDGTTFFSSFSKDSKIDFSNETTTRTLYTLTIPVSIPEAGYTGDFLISFFGYGYDYPLTLASHNLSVLRLGADPSSPGSVSLEDYLSNYPTSPAQYINGVSVGRPSKISDNTYYVPLNFAIDFSSSAGGMLKEPLDVRVTISSSAQGSTPVQIGMTKNGSIYTASYGVEVPVITNTETQDTTPVTVEYSFYVRDADGRIYSNHFLSKNYSLTLNPSAFANMIVMSIDTGTFGGLTSLQLGQVGQVSIYVQSYQTEYKGLVDLYIGLAKQGRLASGPALDGYGVVYLSETSPGSGVLTSSSLELPAVTFDPSSRCINAGECQASVQFQIPSISDPNSIMYLGNYKWIMYLKKRDDGSIIAYVEKPFSIGNEYYKQTLFTQY